MAACVLSCPVTLSSPTLYTAARLSAIGFIQGCKIGLKKKQFLGL